MAWILQKQYHKIYVRFDSVKFKKLYHIELSMAYFYTFYIKYTHNNKLVGTKVYIRGAKKKNVKY